MKKFTISFLMMIVFIVVPFTSVSAATNGQLSATNDYKLAANSRGIQQARATITFRVLSGTASVDPYRYIGYNYTSSGIPVEILQAALKYLNYNVGYIDGKFGPKTHAALLAFQSNQNLGSDGICGPKTWYRLKALIGNGCLDWYW